MPRSGPKVQDPDHRWWVTLDSGSQNLKTNPKPNYTGAYKKSKTGNPNEFLGVRKDLTPKKMSEFAKKFKEAGATILGGCCETRPAHIQELSKLAK